MLIFIIPLRSRATARDWSEVSRLAIRCLKSVCQQDHPEFRAVLVCNEPPEGLFEHPKLSVVAEAFTLPGTDPEERMADKWTRVKRGLIETRSEAPAYYMCVDADDVVHRGLAGWVATHPGRPGWVLNVSYLHDAGSQWLCLWPDFNRYCGTSSIVRLTAADLPQTMADPDTCCPVLEYGHNLIQGGMAARGTPLDPLPFPGAIYLTDTGQNHTDISLSRWKSRKVQLLRLLRSRYLSAGKRKAFGLYEIESAAS